MKMGQLGAWWVYVLKFILPCLVVSVRFRLHGKLKLAKKNSPGFLLSWEIRFQKMNIYCRRSKINCFGWGMQSEVGKSVSQSFSKQTPIWNISRQKNKSSCRGECALEESGKKENMNWQIDNSNRTEFVYLNENYAKPKYLNFVKFSFGCCLLHKKAVQKTTRLYVWVKNNLCGKLLPMAAFWTYLMTLICPYRVVECTFSLAHFRHEYSLLYAILSRLRWNVSRWQRGWL